MAAANGMRWGGPGGPQIIGAVSNVSLNGTGIAITWIVDASTTDPITKIRFRYGARTGTPPTYKVTIEGVDSSGNPDGTDKGGASPTATNFTPPANTSWDGTMQEVTLTNPYTPVSRDEVIAITIRYSSGTNDASNLGSFTARYADFHSAARGYPYHATLSGGTWTKSATVAGAIAWCTASKTYGWPILATYATSTASTAGHRSGMYFTIPSGHGQTFSVSGVHGIFKAGTTGGSFKLGLWDSSWNVIASRTMDSDLNTNSTVTRGLEMLFDSPVQLTHGTKYYVGLEVVSGSVYIQGINLGASSDMTAYPNGANQGLVTWNGTTTTETNTVYPLLDLILDDITVPSGSGGALLVAGMGQTGIGVF